MVKIRKTDQNSHVLLVGVQKKQQRHFGKSLSISYKFKHVCSVTQQFQSQVLTQEKRKYISKKSCAHIYLSGLFTVVKHQKGPQQSSVREWYTYCDTVIHQNAVQQFKKKYKKTLTHVTTQMNLRNVMLSTKKPDTKQYLLCDCIYVKFKKQEKLVYTNKNQKIVGGKRGT